MGLGNDAYSLGFSPIWNLASLLNVEDDLIGFKDTIEMLTPRWTVAEDDKAIYILRHMIGQYFKESVPMMEYVPKANSVPLMKYAQKVNYVPMNESALKMEPGPVMKNDSKVESVQMMKSAPKMETDAEEVKSFFGSFIGSELTAIGAEVNVPRVLDDTDTWKTGQRPFYKLFMSQRQ
ncbi:hypothetical protein Tco_0028719 [Tanacetum coccineum]